MLRTRRWGTLATAGLCVCLALTGCTSPDEVPSTQGSEDALSLSPASNVVYKCLTDKGWNPTLTWDGGIQVTSETLPEAQIDLYNADSDECWSKINARIANMQPDEIADVYRSELATRDCLIEHGLEVGTPPSEQQFIDTFQSARWSAYGDSNASVAGEDEWRTINEACPQPAWSLGAP